jgi:hypothetical protein
MAKRKVAHEVWRAIPGHEGYEASNLGRVKSIDKKIRLKNRWGNYEWRSYQGRILKTPKNGPYLRAKLGEHDNGYDVHTLIMRAFVGPPPPGMIVRHKDNDGTNNNLKNLRYGTYQQNYADAVRNGTANRGEKQYAAKLTEQMVREIRKNTATVTALAKIYNVSPTTIHQIRHRLTWRWLR